MSKAHNRNDARSISCPKCGAQIVEPGADVYKCPNCATFYLAKGSGRLDSGNYKHRRHRKDDEGRPNSSGGRSIPENATLINPPAGSINPSNSAGNLLRPHESSYTEELPDSETSSSTTWSSEVASPNGVLEVTSSHFGKWEHRSKNGSAKDFRSVDGSGSTHQDEFLEVAEDKGHWLPVLNSEFRIISETSDARNEHDDSRLPQDMADVQYGESSNIDAIQSMQKHMFDLKILGISDDASLHTRLKSTQLGIPMEPLSPLSPASPTSVIDMAMSMQMPSTRRGTLIAVLKPISSLAGSTLVDVNSLPTQVRYQISKQHLQKTMKKFEAKGHAKRDFDEKMQRMSCGPFSMG